jgi:hypothetical protein
MSSIVVRNILVPGGRPFFISVGRKVWVLPGIAGREKKPGPVFPGRGKRNKDET